MRKKIKTRKGIFFIIRARKSDIVVISENTVGENLRYRPPEEIESMLKYFLVAINEKGEVVGCVGARLYENGDLEIITLKVKPEYEGLGLATILLSLKLNFLRKTSGSRIFAVTTETSAQKLFYPLGFIRVGIQLFHWKVLCDCAEFPKNIITPEGIHLCNEIAVLFREKTPKPKKEKPMIAGIYVDHKKCWQSRGIAIPRRQFNQCCAKLGLTEEELISELNRDKAMVFRLKSILPPAGREPLDGRNQELLEIRPKGAKLSKVFKGWGPKEAAMYDIFECYLVDRKCQARPKDGAH